MTSEESPSAPYELRIDERGVVVRVRRHVTLELFSEIVDEIVDHRDFRTDMPSVWDLRESAGFGELSRAELERMVNISRTARGGGGSYRVAMAAGRDVDFGVGRMLGAAVAPRSGPRVGVFREMADAERFAFGSSEP